MYSSASSACAAYVSNNRAAFEQARRRKDQGCKVYRIIHEPSMPRKQTVRSAFQCSTPKLRSAFYWVCELLRNQIYVMTASSIDPSFAILQASIWQGLAAGPENCVLAVKFHTSVVQSSKVFTLVQPSSLEARPIPATQDPTSPGLLPTSWIGTVREDAFSMLFTISRTLCPVPVPKLYVLKACFTLPSAAADKAATCPRARSTT
jgi:hypothetical protein